MEPIWNIFPIPRNNNVKGTSNKTRFLVPGEKKRKSELDRDCKEIHLRENHLSISFNTNIFKGFQQRSYMIVLLENDLYDLLINSKLTWKRKDLHSLLLNSYYNFFRHEIFV